MTDSIFGGANTDETSGEVLGFDLDSLMGVRSNHSSSSEQVEKMVEEYHKLQAKSPKGYPYKMTTISPEWLGDKELVVLYVEAGGKIAITPILFGAEAVDESIRDSNDRMTRCAAYNITKITRPSKDASTNDTNSRFLKLCVSELQSLNLVGKLASYDRKHLDLAGCIIVKPEMHVDTFSIIAAAISEIRATLWGLHGTTTFHANENDINYLNHNNVTTVVDLTTDAAARDILGNNIFAPIKIRMSHYRNNALSGTDGKQLSPKLEIYGYLDFRPLSVEELGAHNPQTGPAPLLIPQFVMTGLSNRQSEGVTTPTILLDALAGIAQFKDGELVKMLEQSAQYQTTVDKACSTYDWNQIGSLLALEAASRGSAISEFGPINPVVLMTGQDLPTPVQRMNAYAQAFGPLEVLVDTPQSGEMAKVRQQLFSNLNYYHYKFTGKTNPVVKSIGVGGLVPHGTYTRISESAQERRDDREVFNALGMMAKFHHGATPTDNFIRGMQHAGGKTILENSNPDRDFKERYSFMTDVLFEDGSYEIEAERHRVVVGRPYLDQLIADASSAFIKYDMRNSGADVISRITATVVSTSSIDFNSAY